MTDRPNQHDNGNSSKPTHVVKQRFGEGKAATYERIGVAWVRENGSAYIKVHGTQIVSGGFSLYPIEHDR